MSENFKEKLQKLIAENKMKPLFAELRERIKSDSELHTEFLLLSNRYNAVNDAKMAARIDFHHAKEEINKINHAILHFINRIDESMLKDKTVIGYKKITNPVLLISNNEQNIPILEDFLEQLNFVKAKVVTVEGIPEVEDYDLIIFDNRDLVDCPSPMVFEGLEKSEKNKVTKRIMAMEQLISETSVFLLHFGERLYWINSNRARVQAANSIFSLYARSKEVLDFIDAYRV